MPLVLGAILSKDVSTVTLLFHINKLALVLISIFIGKGSLSDELTVEESAVVSTSLIGQLTFTMPEVVAKLPFVSCRLSNDLLSFSFFDSFIPCSVVFVILFLEFTLAMINILLKLTLILTIFFQI